MLAQLRQRMDTAAPIAPDLPDPEKAQAPSRSSHAALNEALILGSGTHSKPYALEKT